MMTKTYSHDTRKVLLSDLYIHYKARRVIIDSLVRPMPKYDWRLKDDSALVESILLSVQINPILAFEVVRPDYSGIEVFEGRQRLKALFKFLDDGFKLRGLTILKDEEYMGFSDLKPLYRSKLEDAIITLTTYNLPLTEEDKKDLIKRLT